VERSGIALPSSPPQQLQLLSKASQIFYFFSPFPENQLLNPRHEARLTFCGGQMKKGRAETLPSFVNKSQEKNSCFEFKENVFIGKMNNFLKDQMKSISFFLKFSQINIYPFPVGVSHPQPCSVVCFSAGTVRFSLHPFPCRTHLLRPRVLHLGATPLPLLQRFCWWSGAQELSSSQANPPLLLSSFT